MQLNTNSIQSIVWDEAKDFKTYNSETDMMF